MRMMNLWIGTFNAFWMFLWSCQDNCRCWSKSMHKSMHWFKEKHPDWRRMTQMGPKNNLLICSRNFYESTHHVISTIHHHLQCGMWQPQHRWVTERHQPYSLIPAVPLPQGWHKATGKVISELRHPGAHQCHPPLYPLCCQVVDIYIWTFTLKPLCLWTGQRGKGAFQHPSGVSPGVKAQQCLLCWLPCLLLVYTVSYGTDPSRGPEPNK